MSGSPYFYQSGTGGGGSGGSGGINYASNLFAGTSISGINTYNDGASAVPTDGTGGVVAGLSTTLNTSVPLRSPSNQRFSKDASNRQGEGWSWDFVAAPADYEGSKPLIVTFRYRVSSGYTDGDLRLFAYDKDAGQLLNVLSITGDGSVQDSEDATLYTASFSLNDANNDYRLIFHITSTNASAWDFDIIDWVVTPQNVVPGAIVTPWESYTPTTAGLGAVSSVSAWWRRVGDTVQVSGNITVGTTTGTPGLIGLPSGLSIDYSKAPPYGYSGTLETNQSNNVDDIQFRLMALSATSSTSMAITRRYFSTPNTPLVAENVNNLLSTGAILAFQFTVPVVGWLASAALSTTETMFSDGMRIRT